MNTSLKLMALVSVSMLPAIASGHAQTVNCAGMPAELSQLNDGALFYRIGTVRRHAAWAPLSQGDQLDIARPTFVEFIYVAKENWLAEGRPGAIVIKSGRSIETDRSKVSREEPVNLRRPDGNEVDNKSEDGLCKPLDAYFGLVRAQSYDRYHDTQKRIPSDDLKTLHDKFHVAYSGRYGCRRTDSNTHDSILRGQFRSNLGQFSFNTEVVGRTTGSQLLASFGYPAQAASGFSGRSVEVRRYRTNENKFACLKFGLKVAGPSFFLRINDLDRVSGTNLDDLVRGNETERMLSR